MERGIGDFKSRLDLVPCKGLLRENFDRRQSEQTCHCAGREQREDEKDVIENGEESGGRRRAILDRRQCGVVGDPDKRRAGSRPVQKAKGKAGEDRERHCGNVRKHAVRS